MSDLPVHHIVALWGLGLGAAFGAVAQRTNFCTMGALSDIVFLEDFGRFRAWLLAMATAIAGTQALDAAGLVDTGKAIYATPNLGWLGAIVGGAMFGFGMTLAGGCGSRTLVRLGAGNLKSLVVLLVLGLFAYMALRGLTGAARMAFVEPTNLDLRRFGAQSQLLPDLIASASGLGARAAQTAVAVAFVAGLLVYCFKDPGFRRSAPNLAGGVSVGLLVAAGWYATGVAGNDDFDPTPLASFTFVAPVGDTMIYLMTWTGAKIGFGVASVAGVILGAFIAARATGEFRVESFTSAADFQRHIAGAALMGTGGVLALGCTIGQGITGLSTLAAGSVLAVASIVAGGLFGMRYLEQGAFVPAFKALFARA
jgi:uncharacterized membrane protein YedE/YeeE